MRKVVSIAGTRCASKKEIKTEVEKIITGFSPLKIVLFGSYASGEAEPESDVDLLVIHDSTKSNLDLQVEISLALDHSFPLDIVVRKREEIETRSADNDFFIKNIFERGIVLYEQTG